MKKIFNNLICSAAMILSIAAGQIAAQNALSLRAVDNGEKVRIAEGADLIEENLISLYVFDVETGIAKKRFVRRANYMFMLDSTKGNGSIGKHFGWVPDADGKFQLVYPVLEPDEMKK